MTADPFEHECPCTDALYAVSEQGSAWTGTTTINPAAFLASASSSPISINGQTLAVGAADGTHLYAASHPPTIANVTLKRLSTPEPELTLKAHAAATGQPIKRLTLQLPPQLKLKTSHRARVRVPGASRTQIKIKRNTLIVTLMKAARRVSITIGDGAIMKSAGLGKALRKLSHSHGANDSATKRGISVNLSAQLLAADGSSTTADISCAIR